MQKHKQICFYSHFGAGDLFNSREIIKAIIVNNYGPEYFYAHSKDPDTFHDIFGLGYSKVHDFMKADKAFIEDNDGNLYINTWIGRDSKYVLPGVGCTLEKYMEMFNDILPAVGLNKLNEDINLYIPTIWHRQYTQGYVEGTLNAYEFQRYVLICNGDVQSNQAENFDFSPIIDELCREHPKTGFIITNSVNFGLYDSHSNIIDVSEWNLNSISALSEHCSLIVGRSSGPYVYSQVRKNLEDPYKTFISFTYHENATKLSTTWQPKAKMVWSPETAVEKVLGVIKGQL